MDELMSALPIPINEEMFSAEELLARCSADELLTASRETSKRYEGIVLAAAVRIAVRRTGLSVRQFAMRNELTYSTLNRWALGEPMEATTARRALQLLALAMESD